MEPGKRKRRRRGNPTKLVHSSRARLHGGTVHGIEHGALVALHCGAAKLGTYMAWLATAACGSCGFSDATEH